MVKKRNRDPEVLPDAPAAGSEAVGEGDEDFDVVDLDFEWFNYQPDCDFHSVKHLIRQLLDVDTPLMQISQLADFVIEQSTIGSTVKTDGEKSDAYSFLTVINLHENREKAGVKELRKYLIEKTKTTPELASINKILDSTAQVGLILSERLINVPAEISPPSYSMLLDEIETAVDDKEPYEFTHYLILSKTYREIASALDQEDAPSAKKKKGGKDSKEILYFHAEDEVLQKHASASGNFEYTNDEGEGMADSKRAFSEMGIKAQGLLILIEGSKFEEAVKAANEYLSSASAGK